LLCDGNERSSEVNHLRSLARSLLEGSQAQRMVSDETVRGPFHTLLCVVRMAALFKNLPASFRTPPVQGCFKAHGQRQDGVRCLV